MKARKTFAYAAVAALLAFAALECPAQLKQAPPSKEQPAPAKTLWTCGMHPQVVLDHPGDCPICHMKLTPMREEAAPLSGAGASLKVSSESLQSLGLKTGLVGKGPVSKEVRTVGIVDFDETSLADVTMKVRGWIEKLDVDFTGREVHKGEPLFEFYSPELYSAQTELLVAAKQGAESRLAENARTKLRFLDVSEAQIEALEKSGKPGKTLEVAAPRDGFVLEKNAVQGQMLEPGARVYRIADLGTVWVLAQVYERDLPFVKLGQKAKVEVSYLPGRVYHGVVSYVYPVVEESSRAVKVRLELHNPGYTLKPGMYVNVSLSSEIASDGILVPEEAILRGGDMDSVFIALGEGRFEPRRVKLGPRVENGFYQVLSGLKEGERVVLSGQFLLDSEANMKAALGRLSTQKAVDERIADQMAAEASKSGRLEYVCPMPEHMSVSYKEPGKCPLCGMELVPVDASEAGNAKMELDHYTCPMPEHSDVHEAKPGKCPKCGMTLIPVMKPAKEAPRKAEALVYVCPMHPEVREAKPGKCPKCGMNLVPEAKK